ncbi:cation channel family protein (macronuclear) [Tetrahymena thermophila SB210]|uniref:Cation channel family protein n=1 Tax=Tetrahymena thermophila (strain SB210) TaxID=312017 RepID=I7MLM7_TETTS|nr:cation channel family protein [Tetrahymena thermophila SB210]EAS02717.2 cation channel family protein [Tetrahymena thermophila SB210]|eukprot:XP_001022962.2 cation channel family protein [Tetrahymena thermophila SB210]
MKKDLILEEQQNHNKDDEISQIIHINSEMMTYQQQTKFPAKEITLEEKQDHQINQDRSKKQNLEENSEQDSYQQSDNIEFHSNLESIERIEMEQRQEKNSKLQSNTKKSDKPINIEMVELGFSENAANQGYNSGSVKNRNQQSPVKVNKGLRQANKSLTTIQQEPHDFGQSNKADSIGSKLLRQIKTTIEHGTAKKFNISNKMTTSINEYQNNIEKQNKEESQINNNNSAQRRGGSEFGGAQMTRSQKRKTFLNLRQGTAKIKNFFSRTLTQESDNIVFNLVLNSWRFISNLKRVSTIWKSNLVTPRQIEMIDDSTHFDPNSFHNRKRKLFGTSFSGSRDTIYKSYTSIQGRKKQEDSLLMTWILQTLICVPIINPQSQILYIWDIIHSTMIILNLLIQPIEFVTYTHMELEYSDYFWKVFPYLCFTIFIVHIILNFNIGFYDRGICIMDRKQVMVNYFMKGFIWDLLALLPVIDSMAQFESAWRIVNVFVVCKYITLRSILAKYLELCQLQNQSFVPYIKLLQLSFLVLFVGHFFACLFLGLAKLEEVYNFTNVTWIQHYSSQQQSQKNQDADLMNGTVFSKYIYSFYWSVTTMTTTGYGDIAASNNYEATFCAFTMIFAGGVFAYSFNQIGYIVSEINTKNTEFQKDINLISRYLNNLNIKKNLQLEVIKYMEYKHRAEAELSTKEEKEVLDKLGPNIRDKITISANIQLIKQVPFLINNFSRRFLSKLALQMQKETYLNNEIIFEENDFYVTNNPLIHGQYLIQNQQNNPIPQLYLQLQQQQQQQQMLQQPIYYQNAYPQNISNNGPFQNVQHNIVYQQQSNQLLYPQQQQNFIGSQSVQLPYGINQNYTNQQQQNTQNQINSVGLIYNNPLQLNVPLININQNLSAQQNMLQVPNHNKKLSGSQVQLNIGQPLNYQNNLSSPIQNNLNNGNNQFRYSGVNMQQTNSQNNQQSSQQTYLNNQLNEPQSFTNQNNGQNIQQNPFQQQIQFQSGTEDYCYVQTLQQSQSETAFYIVEKGSIQLYTKCFKYAMEEVTTKPIKELKKGELFGEFSFFTEKPRCASAKSLGPCSVLSIKKKDFIKLLKEFPSDYEIYCQIHDEIVNNDNLNSLQIKCYSCDRYGHITQKCNKIHYQPDKEAVILRQNFRDGFQYERNKDAWRRVQKVKCLNQIKEIVFAQKKIEATLQNQSQLSGGQANNLQLQGNQNTHFKNNSNSNNNTPSQQKFNSNTNNHMNDIRKNQKKLTLRQLQTMQTQIVDQDTYIPPSPLLAPQQNVFNYNIQNVFPANILVQKQQTQQNLQLNTQNSNQRQSFLEQQNDPNQQQIQNFYSSFQSKIRGSLTKEQVIFEDDNENPLGNSTQLQTQKFIPLKIQEINNEQDFNRYQQEQQKRNNVLEVKNLISPKHDKTNSFLNTAQLNIKIDQQLHKKQKSSQGRRLQNKSSISFNNQSDLDKGNQVKFLDKPPQQNRVLIQDIAAALGDSFDKSISSEANNEDKNASDQSSYSHEYIRQRSYKHPVLNKQKSFTTENTPQNQKILRKINEVYQNIGIQRKQSRYIQKNLLLQQIQNTILQNLEQEGVINFEDGNQQNIEAYEELQQINEKAKKLTQIAAAKKEMVFEFPSLNTDRMKNFKSYYVDFNCPAVLNRLLNYKPNAFIKRDRRYHIYYRDTKKRGFENVTSFHVVTPANSRSSNPNQISKIANLILNSNVKNQKKTTIISQNAPRYSQKFSIIESRQPYFKNHMLQSQSQFNKVRSNTLFYEESDDEF